jgi:PHD/YefM family antitoxin component YafN of YafNO toxin-antitoxin module
MTIRSLTGRAFNRDTSKAKKAALDGPVFITDRGRPAHVLMTMAEYQRITGRQKGAVELLSMPGGEDFEFEPTLISASLFEPADLD